MTRRRPIRQVCRALLTVNALSLTPSCIAHFPFDEAAAARSQQRYSNGRPAPKDIAEVKDDCERAIARSNASLKRISISQIFVGFFTTSFSTNSFGSFWGLTHGATGEEKKVLEVLAPVSLSLAIGGSIGQIVLALVKDHVTENAIEARAAVDNPKASVAELDRTCGR